MRYGSTAAGAATRGAPRLPDQVRARSRAKHYALRTEQAHVSRVRRFILANGKRHPRGMGAMEVGAFFSDLAARRGVAAETQIQASAALLFLYREVLRTKNPVDLWGGRADAPLQWAAMACNAPTRSGNSR